MLVVTQDGFGGPGVLSIAEAQQPEPLPTEVLVRVAAAGVNPVDAKTRSGRGMARVLGDPPFTVGWDVAGVVEAVGRGVTRFAAGDRVFGMPWFPRQAAAYAEYVTSPSRQLARVPEGLDILHAGALPLASLTAWQALVDTAGVGPGDRVLVHGATGGVGHLAVQIAAARGATVVATGRAARHDLLRELGARETVDSRAQPLAGSVAEVDVALDLVGTLDSGRDVLSLLRPGGLLIAVPSGADPTLADEAREAGRRVTGILVEPDGSALEAIAALVADGRLRVLLHEVVGLREAPHAHELLEAGGVVGKIVLDVRAL